MSLSKVKNKLFHESVSWGTRSLNTETLEKLTPCEVARIGDRPLWLVSEQLIWEPWVWGPSPIPLTEYCLETDNLSGATPHRIDLDAASKQRKRIRNPLCRRRVEADRGLLA